MANVCECAHSLLCPGIAARRIQHAGLFARTCSGGNSPHHHNLYIILDMPSAFAIHSPIHSFTTV